MSSTNLSKAVGRGSHAPLKRDTTKNIDASIAEQRAYDFLVRQQEAKEWIEAVIGEKMPPGVANFSDNLRDGVTLCKLGQVFAPQCIGKIHVMKAGSVLEFMAVDNLSRFIKACIEIEFPKTFLFEVTDLWEKKNIFRVVHCIHTLANFLAKQGKTLRIKNLSKAGLIFDAEEIQKTKEELKKLDDLGVGGESLKFSMGDDDYEDEDGAEKKYESDDDDDLLDGKSNADDDLADPDMCLVEGEGKSQATAGVEAHFTIVARDVNKKEITHGGETFQAVLFSKKSDVTVKAQVKDLENGRYEATYTPEIAGDYELEIQLIDEESTADDEEPAIFLLKGCPLPVLVLANPNSDPSQCVLDGLGLTSATAGVPIGFHLESRDKFGNRGRGNEHFCATLTHSSASSAAEHIEAKVTDKMDGTYEFVYTCPKSGTYVLKVFLNDETQLVGEPRSVMVKDAGISDPTKTDVLSLDHLLPHIIAGDKHQITIVGKDKHGNNRSSGGEKFLVILQPQGGGGGDDDDDKNSDSIVSATVSDLNDGTYLAEFVAEKSGPYDLLVSLNDVTVKSTPVLVKPCPTTDASKCRVSGNYRTARAGETKTMIITACDNYGNRREDANDTFELQIISKTTIENVPDELLSIKNNNDGTYEATFVLQEASEYAMQLTMKLSDDKFVNVNGFPCDILVTDAGVSSAANTMLEGDGLGTVILNEPSKFNVVTRDRFNNKRSAGGDKVEVMLINEHSKISMSAEVTDLEDGTYEVNYVPSAVGDYKIELRVNGETVVNDFTKPSIRVNAKAPNELSAEELDVIHDHDLLSSLLSSFSVQADNANLISEINEVRTKLIRQIRDNTATEQEVKNLERKIQLLILNRLKIEEVLNTKGKKKKTTTVTEATEDNDERKRKLDKYSNLFYLLQTEPKYLSQALYLVPADKMDKFLETVILTLYGYAFSPREEYLILNLFKITLQLEIQQSIRVGSFLNENPVLPKMVMTYGRRLQGKTFLQKVLFDKIIAQVLNERDLNLELNAVKIFKEHISKQEVETGVKSGISMKDITTKRAMEDEQVAKIVTERAKRLTDICQSILDGIIENIDELPYGLRWVCKQLNIMMTQKHPDSTDIERSSVIGYIAYYRFMNPPICAPDAFQLTKKKISLNMRNNLVVISKVLTNLTNNILFDTKSEDQLYIMNEWLEKNKDVYINGFIKNLINVKDPEETLGVHKYMELTIKKAPSITITWNELFSTHALLKAYLHKLVTDDKDPLKILMNQLGEVPQELPPDKNEEITLPLVNAFSKEVDKEESENPEHLYDETKENFRTLLRHLPPDSLGDSVVDTLESAKKYAKSIATQKKDISQLLLNRIEKIETTLPKLEELKILTKQNRYRKMLVDITKEIQNERDVKEKQKIELARLKDSLKSLEEHYKFLTEKTEGLEQYIEETRKKHYEEGAKRNKRKTKKKDSFKFSYKQLAEKHKVIEDISVGKAQRSLIKFQISMPVPGKFDVEAMLAGKTLHTIQLDLDELLDKQSRHQETIEYDGVKLNVNMTIHMLNKLFSTKH